MYSGAESVGESLHVLLVAAVVLVRAGRDDAAGRDRRHERLVGARSRDRRPEVLDVRLQRRLADVGDGPGADDEAGHAEGLADLLAVPGIEVRVGGALLRAGPGDGARARRARRRARATLEAGESAVDVVVEARLALLAVADRVDAELDLSADDGLDGGADGGVEGGGIEGLAVLARVHRRRDLGQPGNAADVGSA